MEDEAVTDRKSQEAHDSWIERLVLIAGRAKAETEELRKELRESNEENDRLVLERDAKRSVWLLWLNDAVLSVHSAEIGAATEMAEIVSSTPLREWKRVNEWKWTDGTEEFARLEVTGRSVQ